jgi:hypothetical protein
MPESGKVNFNDLLKGFWDMTQDVLAEVAYREGSKIEGVRQAIDKQKVVEGKNLLWKVFPFMVVGVIGIWALTKV